MKNHIYGTLFCLGMGTPALALIGEVLDTAGDIAKGTTSFAADVVDPSRRRPREVVVVEKHAPAPKEIREEEPQEKYVVKDEDDVAE
jgi:hypothetical protein